MKNEEKTEKSSQNESVFEISADQLDEIRRLSRERVINTKHKWVQRGSYLVCTSCDFEHGIHIGTNQILTGIDDSGHPILKHI